MSSMVRFTWAATSSSTGNRLRISSSRRFHERSYEQSSRHRKRISERPYNPSRRGLDSGLFGLGQSLYAPVGTHKTRTFPDFRNPEKVEGQRVIKRQSNGRQTGLNGSTRHKPQQRSKSYRGASIATDPRHGKIRRHRSQLRSD